MLALQKPININVNIPTIYKSILPIVRSIELSIILAIIIGNDISIIASNSLNNGPTINSFLYFPKCFNIPYIKLFSFQVLCIILP